MSTRILLAIFLTYFSFAAMPGLGQDQSKPQNIYLIGNSLTWDTVPSRLDGSVSWHVDCGKSLPWMHDHPQKPCVKSSRVWTQALQSSQFDIVCFQPHYGSNLTSDVETISKWIKTQKNAVFVIHSGWARSKSRNQEYAQSRESIEKDPSMVHSPAYFKLLTEQLKKKFPDRQFRQTHASKLLAKVAEDIEMNRAPFAKIEDLYRDAIHMKLDSGRYLMHNAMRIALGQPLSKKGFESIDPKVEKYFNQVLTAE